MNVRTREQIIKEFVSLIDDFQEEFDEAWRGSRSYQSDVVSTQVQMYRLLAEALAHEGE